MSKQGNESLLKRIEDEEKDTVEKILENLSLEEMIEIINIREECYNIQLDVISLSILMYEMSIVRSSNLPEYGFLLWTTCRHDTRYKVRLAVSPYWFKSRKFPVVCLCCVKSVDKTQYQYLKYCDVVEFDISTIHKIIHNTCIQYGIHNLFVRGADRNSYKNSQVRFIEANQWQKMEFDQNENKTKRLPKIIRLEGF